jgi:hypothetical protein
MIAFWLFMFFWPDPGEQLQGDRTNRARKARVAV